MGEVTNAVMLALSDRNFYDEVLRNVNVGHAYHIGVFPLGLRYEIDCDNKTLTLLESATA